MLGTSGSALFTFNDTARTEMYDITIVATLGSETRTLQNSVRSGISVFQQCMTEITITCMSHSRVASISRVELTAVCDAHLINKGVLLDGNNATIYLQPTGPDSEARILDLECRCRPNDLVFMPCKFTKARNMIITWGSLGGKECTCCAAVAYTAILASSQLPKVIRNSYSI